MYEDLLALLDATPGDACPRAAAAIRALIEDRAAAWSEANAMRREKNLLVDWTIRQLDEGWHIDGLITGREPFATREDAAAALIGYLGRRPRQRPVPIAPVDHPAANPRTEATRAARDEILKSVGDISDRHRLTFAEVLWCLAEILRWWSESALDAERRGRDEG